MVIEATTNIQVIYLYEKDEKNFKSNAMRRINWILHEVNNTIKNGVEYHHSLLVVCYEDKDWMQTTNI